MSKIENLENKLHECIKNSFEPFFSGEVHFGPRLGFEGVIKGSGISNQVSLTGAKAQGILVLQSDMESCTDLAKMMLGTDELSEEDVLDGFGELGNILSGTLKGSLGQEGILFNIGIPQVQKPEKEGARHTISLKTQGKTEWIHQPIIIKGKNLSIYLSCSLVDGKSDKKKILVIEDEVISGKALVHHLQQQDYEVILAADALTGIQMAVSELCDMVITDINMPKVNGAAVVGALQVILPDTKVLVCSSLEENEIKETLGATAGHVKAIIQKPASNEDIAKIVQTNL